jgi:hypothetical protein
VVPERRSQAADLPESFPTTSKNKSLLLTTGISLWSNIAKKFEASVKEVSLGILMQGGDPAILFFDNSILMLNIV